MLICAGWSPQDGVRRGRVGGSEVERHASRSRWGSRVVAHSRIAGQAPRAAARRRRLGPGLWRRAPPPLRRGVARSRGQGWPQATPEGLGLDPGEDGARCPARAGGHAGAPPRGGGGGGCGGGWGGVGGVWGVAVSGVAVAGVAVSGVAVSGRVASDQHQPASSRAMATQVTVWVFLRVLSWVQRACRRWLPACPRAWAAAGAWAQRARIVAPIR